MLPHLVSAPHDAPVVAALLPGVANPSLLVQDRVVEGVGLLLEIALYNNNLGSVSVRRLSVSGSCLELSIFIFLAQTDL